MASKPVESTYFEPSEPLGLDGLPLKQRASLICDKLSVWQSADDNGGLVEPMLSESVRKPLTDLLAAPPVMGERVPQGVVFEARPEKAKSKVERKFRGTDPRQLPGKFVLGGKFVKWFRPPKSELKRNCTKAGVNLFFVRSGI